MKQMKIVLKMKGLCSKFGRFISKNKRNIINFIIYFSIIFIIFFINVYNIGRLIFTSYDMHFVCPECGYEKYVMSCFLPFTNDVDDRYCSKCGYDIDGDFVISYKANNRCINCGNRINSYDNYCHECGNNVEYNITKYTTVDEIKDPFIKLYCKLCILI